MATMTPSAMSHTDVISRIDWAYHHANTSLPGGVAPSRRRLAPLAATTRADANDESLQRYKQSLGLGQGKDLSDPNDPRVCIIQSLTMEAPGRDPVTIDLSVPGSEKTLKDKPFKIKEGAKFTMVATFRVQHEILSGLHYVQVVKRKGIKVSKDSEMIGSYAPNTDKQPIYTKKCERSLSAGITLLLGKLLLTDICAQTHTVHEEEAPSGMLARGHYNAISSFVDDDKKKHLEFECVLSHLRFPFLPVEKQILTCAIETSRWSFDIAKDW